jgi:hypothetical protein
MRARPLVVLAAVAAAALLVQDAAHAAGPWVERDSTLHGGDWSFDFGLGVGHVPGPDDNTGVGVNAEMAVGLTNRIELGVRTGLRVGDPPIRLINADDYGRLFDRQTLPVGAEGYAVLANPELRITGAIVRAEVIELGLQGRVVLPFADPSVAGMEFGVPIALHLGAVVRIDTGAYMPFVFFHNDTEVGLHLPVDVWIQATRRFWIGPMTGLEFGRLHDRFGDQSVSLGMGLGYQFTHALDLKAMLLFPEINNESNVFGAGVGLEVRIE